MPHPLRFGIGYHKAQHVMIPRSLLSPGLAHYRKMGQEDSKQMCLSHTPDTLLKQGRRNLKLWDERQKLKDEGKYTEAKHVTKNNRKETQKSRRENNIKNLEE